MAPARSPPPNDLEIDAFDGDTRIWELDAHSMYLFPKDDDQAIVGITAAPMDVAGEPDFREERWFQAIRASAP